MVKHSNVLLCVPATIRLARLLFRTEVLGFVSLFYPGSPVLPKKTRRQHITTCTFDVRPIKAYKSYKSLQSYKRIFPLR